MIKVAVTGATGTMGRSSIKALMTNDDIKVVMLCEKNAKSIGFVAKTKARYRGRVEAVFGDIASESSICKLIKDVDYVVHMAALIPPKADKNTEETWRVNYNGTKNLVDCMRARGSRAKLIHISSVAIYGDRNMAHPWGRVGDPLLPSVFDVYGVSKLHAERYVLESNLASYVVLRQTGILHDRLMLNNIKDGLMFHTPWNQPIEWVTARDSGRLIANIIERDRRECLKDFWGKVFNIGGGEGMRQTGYDVFNDGFGLIGGKPESFFEPSWNATRNFHCFWMYDSDELEKRFHFRSQSATEFWNEFDKKHPIYRLGKLIPPWVLRKLIIEPLLKDKNAPMYWYANGQEARTYATFGRMTRESWDRFYLAKNAEEYKELINPANANLLSHGYDEGKPDKEITLEDVKAAAKYRGGRCLSESMERGDLNASLNFACGEGHVFTMKVYNMLKAGHWCERCAPLKEWTFDAQAKKSPFVAGAWYDSHDVDEDKIYKLDGGIATMENIKRS